MTDSKSETEPGDKPQPRSHGPWRALFSVLAAFFGVQSSTNRDRDERYGNPGHFILFAFVATVVLVALIWVFVLVVMAQAR